MSMTVFYLTRVVKLFELAVHYSIRGYATFRASDIWVGFLGLK